MTLRKNSQSKKENESIDIPEVPSTSFADLSKNIIDEFLSSSSFTIWLFGSILLIALFLIAQNFSKDAVYMPFFNESKNHNLLLTLETLPNASSSGVINFYKYFGQIRLSFNDLLKILLITFLLLMLLTTLLRKFIITISSIFNFINNDYFSLQNLFDFLPRTYKDKLWIADPRPVIFIGASGTKKIIYQQLRYKIPKVISNFKFLKFNIKLQGIFDHWRAGIFITSFDRTKDYVFHIYKNKDDSQLRTRVAKRIYTEGHVYQNDQNLQVSDTQNFLFEIKKDKKDIYNLYINGQLVDSYKVPSEDFKFIEIAGWADDLPYKIEFSNIKVLG